jgi:choline monooxygenase
MPTGIPELLAAFDAALPLDRAKTLPAGWYLWPEVAALERDRVFAQSWQMIGRADQVAAPGQFVTADIAGEPVLAVRGTDGKLRAFFNVCRHKAAAILTEPSGCVGKLRCRYHGWTYDLDGNLRGTPEFDGVCDFRKEDHGLPPAAVAEVGGFVWVHLDRPGEPAVDFLRPFPAWLAERSPLAGLAWRVGREYRVNCNWKVYVDNYLDGGYHVNTVHPALAGVLDYTGYTTTTAGNTAVQTSPLVPADGPAGQTRTGTTADYWWVFPNFMLNAYSGVVDTNLVLPDGPDRCRVLFDFYFPPAADAGFVEQSLAVADQVQAEDAEVCEQVHRGLGSRSYTAGRFSVKRENAGYHFHRLLSEAMARG